VVVLNALKKPDMPYVGIPPMATMELDGLTMGSSMIWDVTTLQRWEPFVLTAYSVPRLWTKYTTPSGPTSGQ
jgi:hypothetical protein